MPTETYQWQEYALQRSVFIAPARCDAELHLMMRCSAKTFISDFIRFDKPKDVWMRMSPSITYQGRFRRSIVPPNCLLSLLISSAWLVVCRLYSRFCFCLWSRSYWSVLYLPLSALSSTLYESICCFCRSRYFLSLVCSKMAASFSVFIAWILATSWP